MIALGLPLTIPGHHAVPDGWSEIPGHASRPAIGADVRARSGGHRDVGRRAGRASDLSPVGFLVLQS
ncbi:hypothetical protein NITMOv2_1285 [Nitrospira moscoviensis]|uniref:Uncharacterized protein n=1 Tax=Nitrospira moscoviensis TaxID=42253 RepID=A0A0K2G9T6_NITMO|nr:hypothetical protein NITMOv2_1285 [Nitrospira moscoviensis]